MSTIVDVVVADKNLATMLRGVKAAGLEIELAKAGPYTVFANRSCIRTIIEWNCCKSAKESQRIRFDWLVY